MHSSPHLAGSRVLLRQEAGFVRGKDGAAVFRITAVDKVPRSGMWYRLFIKDRTLQQLHGGWYPGARLVKAESKLKAPTSPARRWVRGFHCGVDGAVSELTLPSSPAMQQLLLERVIGSAIGRPLPAGAEAVCISGEGNREAALNWAATKTLHRLGGSRTVRVYGNAVFVGPKKGGEAWTSLRADDANTIRFGSPLPPNYRVGPPLGPVRLGHEDTTGLPERDKSGR
ncbi:hypothetical protein [Streptomyces sp. NPDC049555]|uniref:hypothetical protein n=1 Tax=Streptomyces sp. NPDC049555 TaxID=3154930 RepID=UPI00343245AF